MTSGIQIVDRQALASAATALRARYLRYGQNESASVVIRWIESLMVRSTHPDAVLVSELFLLEVLSIGVGSEDEVRPEFAANRIIALYRRVVWSTDELTDKS